MASNLIRSECIFWIRTVLSFKGQVCFLIWVHFADEDHAFLWRPGTYSHLSKNNWVKWLSSLHIPLTVVIDHTVSGGYIILQCHLFKWCSWGYNDLWLWTVSQIKSNLTSSQHWTDFYYSMFFPFSNSCYRMHRSCQTAHVGYLTHDFKERCVLILLLRVGFSFSQSFCLSFFFLFVFV